MVSAVTGMMAFMILACVIMACGCVKEEPGTTDLANATTVSGHVYRDGRPVTGAQVEAVSIDGSQRISNDTNDSGAYVLGLEPQVWYKITASSGSLKHSVLPVYLPEDGNMTRDYNINLTGTSTIEGSPVADSLWKGKGIYLVASPANGDEPIMTMTGEDGHYLLTVKPDVYYTVSVKSYDPFGTLFSGDTYYRNTVKYSSVKPGPDETILLDYLALRPMLNPVPPAPIVNGTVGVFATKVDPPARAQTSPVLAGGQVYRDNKTIRGARVEAISIDGMDHVSALTNETGAYVLKLEPGVMYRATATYNGRKHTIWPLSQTEYPTDGRNDIYLTSSSKSTIAVFYDDNNPYNSTPALIEAIPTDGSEPVIAMTNGSGWYYLDVKPGVKYSLGGRCYDPFGQNGDIFYDYPQDSLDRAIIIDSDETMMANMRFMFFHAPTIISMWRDPVNGNYDPFKSPVPVTVTGRVYIDDRPADGASVTAIMSGTSQEHVSTITNDNGTYVLNLSSRRQYEITATWGGRERTLWPAVVQDNSIGIYDIQLTQRPTSTITGILDPDQVWPVIQGNVITAVPVGGGMPVTAISGADGRYSLDVKPFTYYNISGKSRGTDGEYHNFRLYYRTGVSCDGFMLRPNEMALVDYRVE